MDGRTDRRHKPCVEVSLDGIPISGLREEVSRPVQHAKKNWVGYALKKRAMPNERLLLKKKDRQTDRQTDRRTDRRHKPRVEVSLDGIPIHNKSMA